MVNSQSIKSAGIIGTLGLAVTLIADTLVALASVYGVFAYILGAVLILAAIVFTVLSFVGTTSSERRSTFIVSAVGCLLAGISILTLKPSFHQTNSILDRLVVYYIPLAGISNALCNAFPSITSRLLFEIIGSTTLNYQMETFLYIAASSVVQFFPALLLAVSANDGSQTLFKYGYTLSIVGWAISFLGFGAIGWIIEGKGTPLASAYDSTPDPADAK